MIDVALRALHFVCYCPTCHTRLVESIGPSPCKLVINCPCDACAQAPSPIPTVST